MESNLPLRDIHLPQDIGWWPPAPGWWLLVALILVCVYGLYRAYRYLSRKTAATEAVNVLNGLTQDEDMPVLEKIRCVSSLLRRVAISTDSQSGVAGLHGLAWLRYLDQSVPGAPFTQGHGRVLAEGPYQAESSSADAMISREQLAQLMQLSGQWIKAQK